MRQTFTRLIASLVILINSQIVFAKKTPNYPEGFTPKTTCGVIFTENKGQVYDQNYKPRTDVLFGAMAGNIAFHLKTNGVSYQLSRVDKYKEVEDKKTKEKLTEIDQQTIYRIDLNWINANKNFTKTTDKILEGCNNYYLESCPNGALNVKSYTGVTLHNLYKGINLHYYEKNGQLKHDYIVAPKTDYKQIQIKVEGASVSINKDGSLLLNTPLGIIQEGAPVVYQNGKTLKAEWKVNNNTLSFEIENYNANQELIIDPVTRLWGTYYGGTGYDQGYSCATDAIGNVYLTGYTNCNTSTVIATIGAHQVTLSGSNDAFLVKFNSSGVRLWGTYYGGSTGNENGSSCATDFIGNVYLAGYTNSYNSTLIATAGAYQTIYGGAVDAFLVKFNSMGVRQWATYYGGNGQDQGESCSTDAAGNVYLAGQTDSNIGTVIATTLAHQPVNGGVTDGFLVKFNSSGVRQWATYYGGNGYDQGYSCATDATGNVYFVGHTASNTGTVIATSGAHQTVHGGGDDAFLVKFDSSGVRQWGTYYGGGATDRGNSCITDATGNVFLSGYTNSNTGTVIATAGAHQPVNGGNVDAFLVQFNSSGVRQWGTYYGGTGFDYGNLSATDATSNVYLTGRTDANTGTVIATAGAYQTVIGGGYDAFLVKFNLNGVRQWGTYYGGLGTDLGLSCATDALGNVYLAGYTSSYNSTIIATAGANQTLHGGVNDAFLAKFIDCVSLPTVTAISSSTNGICIGESATLTAGGANTFTWSTASTSTVISVSPTVTTSYTVTGSDVNGCQNTVVITQSVDACTGLSQIVNSNNELLVFPNPFNNKITIVSNSSKQSVHVYNALGSVVYNTIIENEKTEIDLTQQTSGIYFIRIGVVTKKIIKE